MWLASDGVCSCELTSHLSDSDLNGLALLFVWVFVGFLHPCKLGHMSVLYILLLLLNIITDDVVVEARFAPNVAGTDASIARMFSIVS